MPKMCFTAHGYTYTILEYHMGATWPLKLRLTKRLVIYSFLDTIIPYIHKMFSMCNMANIVMLIISSYLVSNIMRADSSGSGREDSLSCLGH